MMEFEDISRKCEKLSLDEEDGPVERISGSLQEKGKQSLSLSLFGKIIANKGGSSDTLGENQRKESSGGTGPKVNNQDSMTVMEGRENLRLKGASNWNVDNESRALLRDGVDSVSTTVIKSGNVKMNKSVSETLEANRKEHMQNVMTPNKEKITESGMQNPTRMEIIEVTSNSVSSENVLIQEEAARLEDSRGENMLQKKWKRLTREKHESGNEGNLNLGKRNSDMKIDGCSERKKIRSIVEKAWASKPGLGVIANLKINVADLSCQLGEWNKRKRRENTKDLNELKMELQALHENGVNSLVADGIIEVEEKIDSLLEKEELIWR
ncbi:hypothetical protein QYF36_026725 [Acer negundo]|nr:hypothetical protein QYF36_026725 [Acer negundo]